MHRVWDVPELIDMILSYLPRSNLAKLARCSRALFTPSAGYLWRTIDDVDRSFKNLCSITDRDAYTHHDCERTLSRLRVYTSSVRTLQLTGHDNWRSISKLAVIALGGGILENGCLLPHIEDVGIRITDWPESIEGLLLAFTALISPSMKKIRFQDAWPVFQGLEGQWIAIETVQLLFAMLRRRCPFIEELQLTELSRADCEGPFLEALTVLLSNWTSLQRVVGGEWILTGSVLRELSQLPSLRELDGLDKDDDVDTETIRPLQIPACVGTGFRSLSSLHLLGRAHEIYALLAAVGPLQDLFLKFSTEGIPSSLGNLISSRSPDLKRLSWQHDSTCIDTMKENALALLSCRKLQYFHFFVLSSAETLPWDDSVVSQMATAWPLLRELQLNHQPSGITFAGFVCLALNCPSLKVVQLYIQSIIAIPLPPNLRSNSQKVSLDVAGTFHPHSATQVAAFFFSLWPNATVACPMLNCRTEWKEVASIMKSYQYLTKTKDVIQSSGPGASMLLHDT